MSKLYFHPLKKKKVGGFVVLLRPPGPKKNLDFLFNASYISTHFFPGAKKSGWKYSLARILGFWGHSRCDEVGPRLTTSRLFQGQKTVVYTFYVILRYAGPASIEG